MTQHHTADAPFRAGGEDDPPAHPMRIGLVAPAWVPTPPEAYGGTENVVAVLAAGLMARGHRVVLVAAPGSDVPGTELVTPLDEVPARIGTPSEERRHAEGAVEATADCDAVLDHAGLRSTCLMLAAGRPVAHVVHGALAGAARRPYERASRAFPGLRLIALSRSQAGTAPGLPWMAVCPNGMDVDGVPFRSGHDGYLAFLGRMSPDKGVCEAIGIARALGLPLRIAAKCREPAEHAYLERRVAPLLGDGVEYLGEIGTAAKHALLLGARALAFPISWDEPFGMVLIEAMAAGTPVLATARGAVPEVVRDGHTGVVRRRPEDLVRAAGWLDLVDPADCRLHVETRFSAAALAARYESVAVRLAQAGSSARRRQLAGARVGPLDLRA